MQGATQDKAANQNQMSATVSSARQHGGSANMQVKYPTERCDVCGVICTNHSQEYCGMDMCPKCYQERKDREALTHTKRMAT